MADNKKYYYLKLKDNFFDSDEIIMLESMENGYIYSNILLKLYLRSLKNNGKLMFNDRIPFDSVMLSKVTRHSVGDVEKAIRLFEDLGLIEKLENGAIFMMDIQSFIGESSTEADRIRAYRSRIKSERESQVQMSVQMYDKSTPEIDIDIELEKELEIDKDIDIDKNQKTNPSISQSQNSNNHIGAYQYIESVTGRMSFNAIAKDELLELINEFGNENIVKKIEERNQDDKFKGSSPIGVIRYIRKALTEDEKDKAKQAESDKKYNELFGDNVGEVSDDWMK